LRKELLMSKDKPPPGVIDVSPASPPGKKATPAPSGFWRIRVFLPENVEPGHPNHVVAARDEVEAEALFCRELGIRSIDKSCNTVEVSVASEADYLAAQGKRLKVDFRSQVDAEGRLTWAPAGYRPAKVYYVRDTGELSEKKPAQEEV
jgi:hypothetical protein